MEDLGQELTGPEEEGTGGSTGQETGGNIDNSINLEAEEIDPIVPVPIEPVFPDPIEITPDGPVDSGALKSKATLKTFFEKGDIPEEEQFADLIDAFRHMDDGHTITNVSTAPDGIVSITLSNGAVVAITPPVTDEYVPKTGGEFTGNIGIGGPVTDKVLHTYGSQVRIETAHGYGSLGAENENAFHFETNLPEIWLGSNVRSYGDIGLSGKNTFMRYDDGAILENNQRVATQNWVNTQGFITETSDSIFFKKSGDTITGLTTMRTGVNTYPLTITNAAEPNFGLYVKNLGTQPQFTESFRLGLKYDTNENNGFISFYRGGGTGGGSLGFATNGVERVKISDNGNVGIGTASTGNGLLTLNGSHTNLLRLENDSSGKEASLRLRSRSTSGGTLHSDISLYATGDNQGYLGFKVPHNNTANAGYDMIINHNGRVGIGTTDPQQGFHANVGQVRISSSSGYGDMGSRNNSWFHFETDRPNFWFNKGVRSNGNLGLYNKDTYMRFSDGAIFENNQRVATQSWGNNSFVSKTKDENNSFFNDYLIFNHNSTTDVDAISFNPSTNGFYFNAATGKSNSSANANVYVNRVIAFDDIATAESVHVAGNVYAGAGSQGSSYFGDGKEIIKFDDEWLRLNPSTTSATRFDSGIYCGTSKLRTDGQFEVGSNGDKFKVTTSGSVSAAGTLTTGSNIGITPGHGKGFRFWGSDSYKIYMSSSTDGTWGGRVNGETTSDYNMYFRMTGGSNRGFVFKNDHNEVAGIDASGNARFNGTIYEGGTALGSKYLSKTAKAADSEKVDGINGASLLRSDVNDTFTGTLAVGSTSTRQAGIYGIYDSTKIGHIWSMGTGFKISQSGANFGNLYGFAYKHTNNPTGGTMAGNHQAVWCSNGTPKVALGDNIWTSGIVYEGGTALSSKYLGKTDKAADSNLLDGKDSSAFLHKTGGTMTGDITMTNRVIRWSENTDIASIGFKNDSDSDANSYMYFKTGDNNNEHFKWLHRASGSSTDSVWMTLKDSSLSVKGNIYSNGTGYYGDGKRIIRFDDGWLRINPDNAFGAGIYCGSSILRTDGQLEVGGNGNKFKVTSGGTVTSAGSITSAGNVTAYSDKRLKTALQPIKENILDKIDQLKPTFYQWKDKTKDQAKQLGFIAQEVKEVFPEWVHENEEYYSMSYDKMGAVLAVQGIQELRAEIKSLKDELKSLKDGFTK